MSLDGKVAFVTGGSGGLGRVHGMVLAQNGANVALTANKNLDKAEEAAEEIRKLGRKAIAVKVDLSSEEEVNNAVAQVKQELGSVDILVNNAAFGIVRAVNIVDMDRKDWDRDLGVNLTGPFNCIRVGDAGHDRETVGEDNKRLISNRNHGWPRASQLCGDKGGSDRPDQDSSPGRS